ncbi:MAG: cupredoxin domain-containing protein [Vicinamibacterales bacterium]
MRHMPYGATLAIVGALALWSCGGGGGGASTPTSPTTSTPTPTPAPSSGTVSVTIVSSSGNTAFSPNPIRANAGQTVMFLNRDTQLHRIVIDGGPDLQDIPPGATSRGFTVANATPVTFKCMLHSSMVGSINGATAPEPPPCTDPYGYGC